MYKVYVLVCFLLIGTNVKAQVAFDDVTELLHFADKNSPAAQQAKLQPQLAKKDKQVQTSMFYPKVNAFASGDYYPILATQLIPAEALGGTPGTFLKAQFGLPYVFAAGAELNVPVINLANWSKLAKAKNGYKQSEWSSRKAIEDLHLKLIQSYYQTLVTKEVLLLNEENEETAVELLRIMTERNEQGVVDPADYNRTKNLQLDVKTARIDYEQRMKQSVNGLNATLDVDTVVLNEELSGFDWPMLYEGGDVTKRPAWQESGLKVRSAELSLKEKRNGVFPTLSLASRYSYNMQTNFEPGFTNIDFNVASVSARVNFPLFQGNYYRSMKQKSKLELQSAKLEQQKVQASLTQQQEDWLAQYNAAFQKHKVLEEKVATSKDNLRIARLNIKEGVMEFDEFNNIFIEYNRARMEYLQNLADGILYHLLSTQNF